MRVDYWKILITDVVVGEIFEYDCCSLILLIKQVFSLNLNLQFNLWAPSMFENFLFVFLVMDSFESDTFGLSVIVFETLLEFLM